MSAFAREFMLPKRYNQKGAGTSSVSSTRSKKAKPSQRSRRLEKRATAAARTAPAPKLHIQAKPPLSTPRREKRGPIGGEISIPTPSDKSMENFNPQPQMSQLSDSSSYRDSREEQLLRLAPHREDLTLRYDDDAEQPQLQLWQTSSLASLEESNGQQHAGFRHHQPPLGQLTDCSSSSHRGGHSLESRRSSSLRSSSLSTVSRHARERVGYGEPTQMHQQQLQLQSYQESSRSDSRSLNSSRTGNMPPPQNRRHLAQSGAASYTDSSRTSSSGFNHDGRQQLASHSNASVGSYRSLSSQNHAVASRGGGVSLTARPLTQAQEFATPKPAVRFPLFEKQKATNTPSRHSIASDRNTPVVSNISIHAMRAQFMTPKSTKNLIQNTVQQMLQAHVEAKDKEFENMVAAKGIEIDSKGRAVADHLDNKGQEIEQGLTKKSNELEEKHTAIVQLADKVAAESTKAAAAREQYTKEMEGEKSELQRVTDTAKTSYEETRKLRTAIIEDVRTEKDKLMETVVPMVLEIALPEVVEKAVPVVVEKAKPTLLEYVKNLLPAGVVEMGGRCVEAISSLGGKKRKDNSSSPVDSQERATKKRRLSVSPESESRDKNAKLYITPEAEITSSARMAEVESTDTLKQAQNIQGASPSPDNSEIVPETSRKPRASLPKKRRRGRSATTKKKAEVDAQDKVESPEKAKKSKQPSEPKGKTKKSDATEQVTLLPRRSTRAKDPVIYNEKKMANKAIPPAALRGTIPTERKHPPRSASMKHDYVEAKVSAKTTGAKIKPSSTFRSSQTTTKKVTKVTRSKSPVIHKMRDPETRGPSATAGSSNGAAPFSDVLQGCTQDSLSTISGGSPTTRDIVPTKSLDPTRQGRKRRMIDVHALQNSSSRRTSFVVAKPTGINVGGSKMARKRARNGRRALGPKSAFKYSKDCDFDFSE